MITATAFYNFREHKKAVREKVKITKITMNQEPGKNFPFLGIVTTEPDYKLSHLLNRELGISLSHSNEETVNDLNDETCSFSKFVTRDRKYALISNKSGQSLLIRKMNKIDFLFIESPDSNSNINATAELIRKINGITAVFILNSNEIREKNTEILRHLTE